MQQPVPAQVVMVEVRSVYGQTKVYPANDAARVFAEIAGSKTLTLATLRKIQQLGYEIISVADADWRKAA